MKQYFNNPFPIDAEFDGSDLQELHDSMFKCDNKYEDTTFKPSYNYTRDNREDELKLPHISIHAKNGELKCRDDVFYRLYDCNIDNLTLADGCTIFIENCNIVKISDGTNCMIHIKQCDGLTEISNASDSCMFQLDDCNMTQLEIKNNSDCSFTVRKGFLTYPDKTTAIDNEGFNTNKQFYAEDNEILNDTINGTNPPQAGFGTYTPLDGSIKNNSDCFFEIYNIDLSGTNMLVSNINCVIELKTCITNSIEVLTISNTDCFIDSVDCTYNSNSDYVHGEETGNDYCMLRTTNSSCTYQQKVNESILSKLECSETNGQYTGKGLNSYLTYINCNFNLTEDLFKLESSELSVIETTVVTPKHVSQNTKTRWFSAYSNYTPSKEICLDSEGMLDCFNDTWNTPLSNISSNNQLIRIRGNSTFTTPLNNIILSGGGIQIEDSNLTASLSNVEGTNLDFWHNYNATIESSSNNYIMSDIRLTELNNNSYTAGTSNLLLTDMLCFRLYKSTLTAGAISTDITGLGEGTIIQSDFVSSSTPTIKLTNSNKIDIFESTFAKGGEFTNIVGTHFNNLTFGDECTFINSKCYVDNTEYAKDVKINHSEYDAFNVTYLKNLTIECTVYSSEHSVVMLKFKATTSRIDYNHSYVYSSLVATNCTIDELKSGIYPEQLTTGCMSTVTHTEIMPLLTDIEGNFRSHFANISPNYIHIGSRVDTSNLTSVNVSLTNCEYDLLTITAPVIELDGLGNIKNNSGSEVTLTGLSSIQSLTADTINSTGLIEYQNCSADIINNDGNSTYANCTGNTITNSGYSNFANSSGNNITAIGQVNSDASGTFSSILGLADISSNSNVSSVTGLLTSTGCPDPSISGIKMIDQLWPLTEIYTTKDHTNTSTVHWFTLAPTIDHNE